MIAIHVAWDFFVTGLEPGDGTLPEQADRIMDALVDLEECNEDVRDSAVSVDVSRSTVTIEFEVLVDDHTQVARAADKAMTTMRTAIHTSGGSTPFWPVEPVTVNGDVVSHEARVYRPDAVHLKPVA